MIARVKWKVCSKAKFSCSSASRMGADGAPSGSGTTIYK